MEDNIMQLEQQALDMLLAGDDPVLSILRRQLEISKRTPSEYTGAGFFTQFDVPQEAPRLPGNASLRFSDVDAELEGVQHGAGFVLHIKNGVLSMLEGFTYDEPWPQKVSRFELRYASGKSRDLSALRKTKGWPTA